MYKLEQAALLVLNALVACHHNHLAFAHNVLNAVHVILILLMDRIVNNVPNVLPKST